MSSWEPSILGILISEIRRAHSSPSACYEEEPRLSENWESADKVALGPVTQNLKDEDVPEGLNTTEREGDTISVSSAGSTKKIGVHLFEVTSPLKNTKPGERIKILYSYPDSICRSPIVLQAMLLRQAALICSFSKGPAQIILFVSVSSVRRSRLECSMKAKRKLF